MSERPTPILTLEHEALSRVGADASRAEWVEALARSGLMGPLEHAGAESDEGRILKEMRDTLTHWHNPPAPTPGLPAALRHPAVLVTLGMLALSLLLALWGGHGSGFFCMLSAGPALWGPLTQRGPRDGVAEGHGPTPEAARLTQLLERLRQRAFVTVIGDAVIEHIPHCAVLRTRIAEVDRAEAAVQARLAEIDQTRRAIARMNQQMGKPVEDVETERLARLLEVERGHVEGLAAMRAELEGTLARTDAVLQELRRSALRRALSERAARLTASSGVGDAALARAEVDLAGFGDRIAELEADAARADARLRALLETAAT